MGKLSICLLEYRVNMYRELNDFGINHTQGDNVFVKEKLFFEIVDGKEFQISDYPGGNFPYKASITINNFTYYTILSEKEFEHYFELYDKQIILES